MDWARFVNYNVGAFIGGMVLWTFVATVVYLASSSDASPDKRANWLGAVAFVLVAVGCIRGSWPIAVASIPSALVVWWLFRSFMRWQAARS